MEQQQPSNPNALRSAGERSQSAAVCVQTCLNTVTGIMPPAYHFTPAPNGIVDGNNGILSQADQQILLKICLLFLTMADVTDEEEAAAERAIEIWKIKKLIKSLQMARG